MTDEKVAVALVIALCGKHLSKPMCPGAAIQHHEGAIVRTNFDTGRVTAIAEGRLPRLGY
jgi:hypothetical protein